MSRLARDGTAEPSCETKLSGANADREFFIFPVQLTTSRIGHLTRLIHTLAKCVTIHVYICITSKYVCLVIVWSLLLAEYGSTG